MERIATIPQRFRWATFDSDDLRERVNPFMIEEARDATKAVAAGDIISVTLLGKAGEGKTSLACAMLRELLNTSQGFSGRFCSATELAVSRKDSRLGVAPADIADAKIASVLVLDDLGQEVSGREVLAEVIHDRHNAVRPTIVTSWLSSEAIAQRYGDGTARRVLEHAAVVRVG
jgi:DNA replication protein DnaC